MVSLLSVTFKSDETPALVQLFSKNVSGLISGADSGSREEKREKPHYVTLKHCGNISSLLPSCLVLTTFPNVT